MAWFFTFLTAFWRQNPGVQAMNTQIESIGHVYNRSNTKIGTKTNKNTEHKVFRQPKESYQKEWDKEKRNEKSSDDDTAHNWLE